ncbi:hypothetical protein Salat_1146700 [Sesamum alatum]|uniref:CCHC-type domain-containing protein n=1 Tax=Sesamum alatum TaxID=300844 RepID=A0AAE1YDX0_9LAMI|nr:hypothetical protein Salat_1146700 [Sesamum alatum]
MGDEHLVHFTYEQLPNFCYRCERLGHIAKYCENQFADAFGDPGSDLPYGPWLRVPLPMRGRSPNWTSSQAAGNTTPRVYPRGSMGIEDLGGAEVEQRRPGTMGDMEIVSSTLPEESGRAENADCMG